MVIDSVQKVIKSSTLLLELPGYKPYYQVWVFQGIEVLCFALNHCHTIGNCTAGALLKSNNIILSRVHKTGKVSSPFLLLTYLQLSSELWRFAHLSPKCLIKALQLCSFYCKEWLGKALTPSCQVCASQLLPRAGAGVMSWILPLITFSTLLVMSRLCHPLPEITASDWRWLEPWLDSETWTILFLRTIDFVRRLTMKHPLVSPGSDH